MEVEIVNGGANPRGEFDDPLTQRVLMSQLFALGDQRVTLVLQVSLSGFEFVAPAQHLLAFDEGGLIEIGETPPLAGHGIDFSFQLGELRLQEFIGGRLATRR